ncbi:MAG: imidazole glycerol phosphate synthase subunit HisH, partial [Pseudomonadota bacterium]
LSEVALHKARPFLGICIGMQLLATRGLEFGETPGLGWVPGDVREIAPCDTSLKVPHMGWNTIEIVRPHALLAGISDGSSGEHAYFVHSFHLEASDKANVIARADYGGAITAAVARDNIVGTQFHPEKSQTLGLRLLANFLKWSV